MSTKGLHRRFAKAPPALMRSCGVVLPHPLIKSGVPPLSRGHGQDRPPGRLAECAALERHGNALGQAVQGDDTLRELAARRRQVMDMRQAEQCRLAMAHETRVKAGIEAMIRHLDTEIAALDAAIEAHIAASATLRRLAAVLRTFKGVGPVTVFSLLAELPELGTLSGKQIAALMGLAPRQHESGKRQGQARIGHGRPGCGGRCSTRCGSRSATIRRCGLCMSVCVRRTAVPARWR